MGDETDQPAGRIIDAFGGIRPMATRLGIPVSTVQGWKQRDTIPAGRMAAVRIAAEANGVAWGPDEAVEAGSVTTPRPKEVEDRNSTEESRTTSPESSPKPGISTPDDRVVPPARGGRIAVLALVVALGVGGWVWWSTLGPGATGGDNARLSALEGRVARLAETNAGNGTGADPAALADLTRDVAALRSKLTDLTAPDLEAALAPLRAEIDGLRAALAAQGAGGGDATLDAGLLARLEAIDVDARNAIQLAETNKQTVADGFSEFDTKLKALSEAQTTSRADIGARVDALESGRSADQAEVSRASTLVLAAGQLRQALERGVPYEAPLDLVGSLRGDNPELGTAVMTLRAMSETGVATRAMLEVSFAKRVPDLLAAGRANAGGGASEPGLVDRLADRIGDIISVRRTGPDVPGDDVEARIARAEIYLADGDIVAALAEFDDLTGPAADILAPWRARAQGHVDAADALAVIEAQAISGLRAEGGSR